MKQTLSNGRITSEMRFSLGLGDKLSSVYVFALKVPYYTNVSFRSPGSSGVTLHTENIFDLRKARCLALCLQPPLNTLGVSLLLDLFALTPPHFEGEKNNFAARRRREEDANIWERHQGATSALCDLTKDRSPGRSVFFSTLFLKKWSKQKKLRTDFSYFRGVTGMSMNLF